MFFQYPPALGPFWMLCCMRMDMVSFAHPIQRQLHVLHSARLGNRVSFLCRAGDGLSRPSLAVFNCRAMRTNSRANKNESHERRLFLGDATPRAVVQVSVSELTSQPASQAHSKKGTLGNRKTGRGLVTASPMGLARRHQPMAPWLKVALKKKEMNKN